MLHVPIEFHDRVSRGRKPTPYLIISTLMGERAYAEKELGAHFEQGGYLANGAWAADGSIIAGSGLSNVSKAGNVTQFTRVDRTISPRRDGLLLAYTRKQRQHSTITMDNKNKHFSQILGTEPFIGRPVSLWNGFEDTSRSAHIKVFTGIVTEVAINDKQCILTVEEQ